MSNYDHAILQTGKKKLNQAKKLIVIGLAVIVSFLLAFLTLGINSKIILAAISILVIITLSFMFHKKAVYSLIIWTMFAGVIRKWIFPGLSDVIFLFSYLILAGIYVRFFTDNVRNKENIIVKHPVNIFIGILVLWGVFSIFNPNLPNILVGVLGFLIHYYYIPLIFILPKVFNSFEKLLNSLKVFSLMSLPLLLLGMIQFLSPPGHPINMYLGTDAVSYIGSHARISSTFAYIAGYAVYLNILIYIVVYLLSLKTISKNLSLILYIILALASLNILMTGSRGPAFYTLFCMIAFLFVSGLLNLSTIKHSLSRIILISIVIVLTVNYTGFGKSIVEAFMTRVTGAEDIGPRLVDTFTTPFKLFGTAGINGFGIGSTYQGSVIFGGNPYKLMRITGGLEEEPERIVVELGVFGFLLTYLIRIAFIFYFFQLYLKLKQEPLRLLAIISLLFQIQFFLGIANLTFNYVSQLFYWSSASFLFLLANLDKKEPINEKA